MKILLVPYDGDQPLVSEMLGFDLVLWENEDGNFEAIRNLCGDKNSTVVTVWDRQETE